MVDQVLTLKHANSEWFFKRKFIKKLRLKCNNYYLPMMMSRDMNGLRDWMNGMSKRCWPLMIQEQMQLKRSRLNLLKNKLKLMQPLLPRKLWLPYQILNANVDKFISLVNAKKMVQEEPWIFNHWSSKRLPIKLTIWELQLLWRPTIQVLTTPPPASYKNLVCVSTLKLNSVLNMTSTILCPTSKEWLNNVLSIPPSKWKRSLRKAYPSNKLTKCKKEALY